MQAGDQSEEMHQRLKELGVAVPTEDIAPALPQAPQPLGNIIPAPSMGVGMPYPLMPQITLGPTEFLSVNGMVTADVLVDDEEYREVSLASAYTCAQCWLTPACKDCLIKLSQAR